MPNEQKAGCARPVMKKTGTESTDNIQGKNNTSKTMEVSSMIRVGEKAPDFTAPGYHKGKFITASLSEYTGKWVVLCFYPGDFTFV